MARYILIDNNSGYIWGDSADLNGAIFPTDYPVEYAKALDASLGETDRTYEFSSYNPRSSVSGYHVYRADINGSDAVATVWDGQDQATISAVEASCDYVGFIAIGREGN